MLRNLTTFFCVVVAVAGCARNEATETTQLVAAQQKADVSVVLGLLQDLADRHAPLVGAATPEQLEAMGAELGCDVYPDGHLIECPSVEVGEDLVFVSAVFTAESAMTFHGDVDGSLLYAHYALTFEIDPERGIVGSGDMVVNFPDRTIYIETEDLVVRLVADLSGPGIAAVFVSGHVTVRVEEPFQPETTGSAALAGASALVALHVDGISSLTTVDLRP